MIVPGVNDMAELYANVTDDALIAKMLHYDRNLDYARHVGVFFNKRPTELEVVSRVREHLDMELPQRPCSGCILSGRRWHKLNRGEPLLVATDHTTLGDVLPNAEALIAQAVQLIQAKFPYVKVDFLPDDMLADGAVPDVAIVGEYIDGAAGTLGVTTSYVSDTTDDLDLGADRWVSVRIAFDIAEFWDRLYFLTVAIHELLHALGLDHAPATVRDIMNAFYGGPNLDFGPWTEAEMRKRHIGDIPA